jgi:hypothetical protein
MKQQAYHISEKAIQDLEDIWLYTLKHGLNNKPTDTLIY